MRRKVEAAASRFNAARCRIYIGDALRLRLVTTLRVGMNMDHESSTMSAFPRRTVGRRKVPNNILKTRQSYDKDKRGFPYEERTLLQ